MGHAAGEEPEVALRDVLLEVEPAVVDAGDAHAALQDVRPLGRVVPGCSVSTPRGREQSRADSPVQVAHGAWAHVRGDRRELRTRWLERLSGRTFVEAHVGAGELAGHGELTHGDLAGPAAILDAHVRVLACGQQVRR